MALTVVDHTREAAGLTYVYPVISRRAGGVSVGINLNINNACNWACIYCQVPNLTRGAPPPIDLALLEQELSGFLQALADGDFLQREVVDPAHRRVVDLAFSGNGEPTAAPEFPAAVDCALRCMREAGLASTIPLRLITNGSQLGKRAVQQALRRIGGAGGEVWFKLDRVAPRDTLAVNGVRLSPVRVGQRLEAALGCAPTWLQTCWFGVDGRAPDDAAASDYVDFVSQWAGRLAGIHLYGIARPSYQPAAARLTRLAEAELNRLAERLREKGLTVRVAP